MEVILVTILVAWAGWILFRGIRKEINEGQCSNCSCKHKLEKNHRLFQIQSPDKQEPI